MKYFLFLFGLILYVATGEALLLTIIYYPLAGYTVGLILGFIVVHGVIQFNKGVYR